WVAGLASGLLWGSGQAMNRQYAKGLVFLTLMVATVATELVTVYYGNLTSYSFRRNGGFFLRGLSGLSKLGTEPRSTGLTGLSYGVHSFDLMVNVLIVMLHLLVIAELYAWYIIDAVRTWSILIRTGTTPSSREYLTTLWQSSYAYI